MKTQKISQKNYDKFAQFPQLKRLMDQAIEAGLLVIKDAPLPPAPPVEQTPDTPTSPTAPPRNWRDWLKSAMLFVSAPDYWWGDIAPPALVAYLDSIKAAGNVAGIDVEFAGKTGAENYIKGINPKRDYAKEYTAQFERFALLLPMVKTRGLIANVKFWNANGNSTGQSATWWKEMAKSFVQRFGTDNLIILAVNERDSATPDATRKAIFQGFIDAGFPKAQMIGYDSNNEYGNILGFTETHPQKSDVSDIKGSSKNHINCTDSRPSISYCYDNWLKLDGIGGKPKLANIANYVKKCKDKGTSCSVYSFRQTPDYEALAAASAAWHKADASTPSQPTAPQAGKVQLLTLKASTREFYIDFTYTDNSHWPVSDNLNGWILINGQRVEQFRPGYKSQHLKNVYGGAPYKVAGIKKGDTIRIALQSRDKKETTNELPFVWPWKNT